MFRYPTGGIRLRLLVSSLALSIIFAQGAGTLHAHGLTPLSPEISLTDGSSVQTPACWSCALAHSVASPAIGCAGVAPADVRRFDGRKQPVYQPHAAPRALTGRGPPRIL